MRAASSPPSLVTLVFATALSVLTLNMFLPSLPSMTAYFQTEYSIMQLSVALFLGVNGVLQLFVGPLSDRYGRRPVLIAGFTLFLLATLGCIYAPNIQAFLEIGAPVIMF